MSPGAAPPPGKGLSRRGRCRAIFAVGILLAIKVFAPYAIVEEAQGTTTHHRQLGASSSHFIEGNTTSGKKCAGDYQVWGKYTGGEDDGKWYHWNGTGWGEPVDESGECCIPSEKDMKGGGLSLCVAVPAR